MWKQSNKVISDDTEFLLTIYLWTVIQYPLYDLQGAIKSLVWQKLMPAFGPCEQIMDETWQCPKLCRKSCMVWATALVPCPSEAGQRQASIILIHFHFIHLLHLSLNKRAGSLQKEPLLYSLLIQNLALPEPGSSQPGLIMVALQCE